MAEKEYIEREAVLERIDGIWDCADMVFEPNDKCCRNELCLRCGQYKTAHLGSCNGCRWRDMG